MAIETIHQLEEVVSSDAAGNDDPRLRQIATFLAVSDRDALGRAEQLEYIRSERRILRIVRKTSFVQRLAANRVMTIANALAE